MRSSPERIIDPSAQPDTLIERRHGVKTRRQLTEDQKVTARRSPAPVVKVGNGEITLSKTVRAINVTGGVFADVEDDIAEIVGPEFYTNGTTTDPAGSPDASTTSTSTYATAFSDTWLLPAGTWTVTGIGSCSFIHSGSVKVDFYVEVNGSGSLTRTPNLSSTIYTRWEDHANATGVVSDGSTPITVKLLYRSNTAGTTTPQAPKLQLTAYRTA